MKATVIGLAFLVLLAGCNKGDGNPAPGRENDSIPYFPPNSGTEWETVPISGLGWNQNALAPLLSFLKEKHTKSFLILVNGRIALEEYFNGHSASATWEWNSAGKTLVATACGIAQQEGLLNINDRVSDYLGNGWSSEPPEKEGLITIRHLLTMTSGLNDEAEWVTKANLTYLADAGTRWSYSNVFQLLMDIVAQASHQSFENYFNARLRNKTGMDGYWNKGVIFTIYHSTTRSMARFGQLALSRGTWDKEQLVNEPFFADAISTSQSINPSYGYLWWLNGRAKYMIPGTQHVFAGSLIPNAPADLYAAMGAKDQRIYIIPGKKMVIVRMGEASDPLNPSFAFSGFDAALWEKLNAVFN